MTDRGLKDLFTDRFGTAPDVTAQLEDVPALRSLAGRASCRKFTPDPVDMPVLETLCAAALCAPSKSDLQQRDILIVSDPGVKAALAGLLGAQEWIAGAPSLIVFLANNRRQRQMQALHDQPFPNDHLDAFFNASVDAGIALAFFMAAAEAAGLGCCPISTIRNHLPQVRDLLGLPDHVFPVAGMAVGHPAAENRISPRLPLASTVHHNRFADITGDALQAYDSRRLAGAPGPGWSEAKAKMYAEPQRVDFAQVMRDIGFRLD